MRPERPAPQDLDSILGDTDLSALVELQQFLADEIVGTLGPTTPADLSAAFVPLTDGLGLEAPTAERRRIVPSAISVLGTMPTPMPPGVLADLMPEAVSPYSGLPRPEVDTVREVRGAIDWDTEVDSERLTAPRPPEVQEIRSERPSLSDVVGDRVDLDTDVSHQPPPLPTVSGFRRLFAGIFDIVFVCALWAFAVVATSRILNDTATDVVGQVVSDFSRTGFMRLAVFEYVALWSAYFLFCQGILDLTLGMWVWGVRVSFGERVSWAGYAARKFVRMLASIIFFAPIAPTLLLIFRIRGRNFLDWLSGTALYRSGT